MRVLKVLHVYRTYFPDPPGGIQEAIRQICLGTREFRVESEIMTLSPATCPRDLLLPEARVWRERSWLAPASCDFGSVAAFRLFAWRAAAADVLHFHFPWPFADLLNMLGVARRPKVMTYHSDIVRQRALSMLYGPLMRRTLMSMDAVVATSPTYIKTSPVLQSIAATGKVKVIPFGIRDYLPEYSTRQLFARTKSSILDRLNLLQGKFVLALGVLRYYKGLHTLIEAANQVDCTIVIAGSGPEEVKLKALAQSRRADNVIFAGQVTEDEKRDLFAGCALFALPSHVRSEAFGMVLVEAAMFGKPMVTCEIGTGTSFVNVDGETGFVVPPESPNDLANAIKRLIGNDELAMYMGKAARARYERMFSGDALGRAYSSLYREVCGEQKAFGSFRG
jgi:rhamnosyl/mannosyltransferase